jgi:hypothetical protein
MVIQDVSHDVIGTIKDLHGKLAAIANLGTSLVGPSSMVGRFLTRIINAAEITKYTSISAKAVLSVAAGDVNTPIKDAVKQTFYDTVTDGLNKNAKALLKLADAKDVTDALVDTTFERGGPLLDLGDQLIQNVSGMQDDLHNRSKDFGGPRALEEGQTTVSMPGGGSITIPDDTDPEAFCTSNPEVAAGLASLGIGCAQFVSATTDAEFFHNVLEPLSTDFIALSQRITQACGAQLEFFDSPACQAVFQESEDFKEQFLQAIEQYGEPDADFKCQGSYTEFPSSVEDTAACIHRSLLETAHNADCPPGSTQAAERGIDVGEASVCVIYSRDFIQRGGTCREGYSLVEYLGTERCRWDGLSTREVAAYSLDKRTGRRTTVLP